MTGSDLHCAVGVIWNTRCSRRFIAFSGDALLSDCLGAHLAASAAVPDRPSWTAYWLLAALSVTDPAGCHLQRDRVAGEPSADEEQENRKLEVCRIHGSGSMNVRFVAILSS